VFALWVLAGLVVATAGPAPAADKFTVEEIGVVERQARIRGHVFSPGTAAYPPRLLIGFVDGDGTWVVNLQDGSARRAEFEDDYLQWPSFIGADGKVFSSCGRGGLSVYDPVVDSFKLIRPIPGARWLRGMAIGPDGAVYVSDYPTGSAARYDPQIGEVTNFGPQGGPFSIKNVYGYSVGCDGRYVYTATGKMPWRVVAYDLETGEQRILLEYPAVDHPEVHQRGNAVFLEVAIASSEPGEPATRRFRLDGGKAAPVESVPRFDDSHVPGIDRPGTEFEAFDRGIPVVEGGAPVRYRNKGDTEWQTALIPVAGQDMVIQRLNALADGRLALATGPYGNGHVFDPVTGLFTKLGNPASKNVYDLLESAGRLYFCGYPNGVLGVFEEGGSGRLLGDWHESVHSKYAKFIVEGADGMIYSGHHNERESTGGALGWFDPSSGRFGGIHFPNDSCEFLTTALDRKLVVFASDFSHDPSHPEIEKRDGQLIIFDTKAGKIVRKFSPLSDGSAGVVVEVEPGIVFGLGLDDKLPVMYRANVMTGEVERREALPAKAVREIAMGPDGRVYFFLKDSLFRADPKTFLLEALCPAGAGRMVFLGSDLYLGGTSQLRRIRSIALH